MAMTDRFAMDAHFHGHDGAEKPDCRLKALTTVSGEDFEVVLTVETSYERAPHPVQRSPVHHRFLGSRVRGKRLGRG